MSLNFAEMKSFYRFLIAALAVATLTLPGVYAQDFECVGCFDCKTSSFCTEDLEAIVDTECSASEACIRRSRRTECVPYEQSPCNCGGGSVGCDVYNNTLKILCEEGILSTESCPPNHICEGDGVCVDPNAPVSGGQGGGSGGQDSGSGGQDSGLGGQDSGSGGQDSGSGGQDSGLGGQDSGSGGQDSGSGGQDSGTTKPATCSTDNANTRYPHETDCKKFYFCRESTTDTYVYVESTCPGNLVYNKDTTYCDLPENVSDCQQ